MATSSASLDRSPRKNWVENAGGLPPYIRKIARAIHEKRGIPLSEAIPFAIGRVKRWAAGGDNVTAETRAKAAAAIAAWERLKAKSGKLTEAEALGRELVPDENLGIPTPLLLEWLDELDEDGPLVEASIRRAIKRLPDGTFAPKGTGSVLARGDTVSVPHRSGRGTVKGTVHLMSRGVATVRLDEGPDAGGTIQVKRPRREDVTPNPDTPAKLGAGKRAGSYTSELYRDAEGHEVWRIKDPDGKVVQSGIASDHDMTANLGEYNAQRRPVRDSPATSGNASPPAGAIVRGNKTYLPGDPDYERLSKIVGPPEPGSPAARAAPKTAAERFGQDTVNLMNDVQQGRKPVSEMTPAQAAKVADALDFAAAQYGKSRLTAYGPVIARLKRYSAQARARARLVEAKAMPATARVQVRTRGGRTLDVSASHALRMHANGTLAPGQVNGGKFTFDEAKHPRGGKGSTAGGKFVKSGSSGTEVRAIQRRVGARVDGQFGDRTTEAVKRFQRSHGLEVDGVVGRQTVAALRGRRDAKRVKTGELSKRDREYLAGHIRGNGRTRTKLVEAVAAPAFLERVRALELGETARLPDGGAVKHHASGDGREMWTAGRPSSYSDDGLSWGEQRRAPEDAVVDALTRSAAATDPASIGGTTRFGNYARVTVNGRPGRFAGVAPTVQPLVRFDGDAEPTAVSWAEIALLPRLVEAAANPA